MPNLVVRSEGEPERQVSSVEVLSPDESAPAVEWRASGHGGALAALDRLQVYAVVVFRLAPRARPSQQAERVPERPERSDGTAKRVA